MNINWKEATKGDRAALYLVARVIADAANTSVEAIMERAYGHELVPGTDYLSNFRSGTIGRPKAKLIHAWIAEHHLTAANAVDPNLFPITHTDAWAECLEHHAITGKLNVVRFDKSLGLVRRKRQQHLPDQVLKLCEEFCFHLSSSIAGQAAAFQIHLGEVHPLPLGFCDKLSTKVHIGEKILPINEEGRAEKLSETTDLGFHKFVMVVAPHDLSLPTASNPPKLHEGVEVHVIEVQFVP